MVNFRGQLLPPWRPPPETIGRLFASRYRIIHKVADGATGAVFRAEDIGARESVALRLLRPEISAASGLVEALQARIRSRVELAAEEPGALSSFVDVMDIGKTADGLVFVVMPYITGDRLGDLLGRSGPVPWSQARGLFLRLCQELAEYHRRGRVHGTLELRKCWLSHGRAVMFLDDGVDAFLGDDASPSTAPYCSPERASGDVVGPAADIYALGVIFYELLTARVPFEDSSAKRTLAMHMLSPVPAPREVAPTAGIPEAVEALILRSLEKRPEDRFASVDELVAAIEAVAAPGAGAVGGAVAASTVASAPEVAAAPVRRAKVHELERFLDPPDAVVGGAEEATPKVRVVDGNAGSTLPMVAASERSQITVIPALTTPAPASAPAAPAGDSAGDSAAANEPTLIGLVLPPLVNPQTLSSGSSSVAAAVAASLRIHGAGLKDPVAPAEESPEAREEGSPASASSSSSGRRRVEGASKSGTRRRQAGPHASASASMRRVIDLHPGSSGSMRARFDDDLHPSSSGSMRMGASASAGASGSRRIVNLVDVRAPSESMTEGWSPAAESTSSGQALGLGAVDEHGPGSSASNSSGELLDSGARFAARGDPQESTILAPISGDDTLAASGIRPGPSRGAISWALGGIGALLAGSLAVALLSPPEVPEEAPATEPRIIAPAVMPVASDDDAGSDAAPAVADEAGEEAEEVAAPTRKKRSRSKSKSSKRSKSKRNKAKKKKKQTKKAAAPEEEEDDLLTQVESYMREKKAREAKQAEAVARSKANTKPAASPADLAAAKDRLKEARSAYKNGKFTAAYSLASQSVALNRSTDALELMALASCARKDADRARQVHSKIAASRRGAIEARCREAGINL